MRPCYVNAACMAKAMRAIVGLRHVNAAQDLRVTANRSRSTQRYKRGATGDGALGRGPGAARCAGRLAGGARLMQQAGRDRFAGAVQENRRFAGHVMCWRREGRRTVVGNAAAHTPDPMPPPRRAPARAMRQAGGTKAGNGANSGLQWATWRGASGRRTGQAHRAVSFPGLWPHVRLPWQARAPVPAPVLRPETPVPYGRP